MPATATTAMLPLTATQEPASPAELTAAIQECHAQDTAVYPLGGETSLDFGLRPRKPGIGLSLRGLRQVIDYPARDLTITVQAGVTMAALHQLLATEKQRLPIDVPDAERATIGGVIATNWNGPRRYGQGTVRDYVIGISAIDGRGSPFQGGGRVVKNVAGYDFCKLLTGSLGTLGVISQVTLRLKPVPECAAVLVTAPGSLEEAEKLLARLVHSATTPAAIELLAGPAWGNEPAFTSLPRNPRPLYLLVALEGTAPEVTWSIQQLQKEWWEQRVANQETLLHADAHRLLDRLRDFPATPGSPLVLKASVVPSQVTQYLSVLQQVDPECSVQSHAGNGIVIARCSQVPTGGITRGLIGRLQAAATAASGTLVVLSSDPAVEATSQSTWGRLSSPQSLMTAVKRQFDPRHILNPDRFVYA